MKIQENQLGIFMVDTKGDAIITTNVSANHRNYMGTSCGGLGAKSR